MSFLTYQGKYLTSFGKLVSNLGGTPPVPPVDMGLPFIYKSSITDLTQQAPILTGDPISYYYDFIIDWGDGVSEHYTQAQVQSAIPSHTYASLGVYDVSIAGQFGKMSFQDTITSKDSLNQILRWGTINCSTFEGAFAGCTGLQEVYTVAGDSLNNTVNMKDALRDLPSVYNVQLPPMPAVTTMESICQNSLLGASFVLPVSLPKLSNFYLALSGTNLTIFSLPSSMPELTTMNAAFSLSAISSFTFPTSTPNLTDVANLFFSNIYIATLDLSNSDLTGAMINTIITDLPMNPAGQLNISGAVGEFDSNTESLINDSDWNVNGGNIYLVAAGTAPTSVDVNQLVSPDMFVDTMLTKGGYGGYNYGISLSPTGPWDSQFYINCNDFAANPINIYAHVTDSHTETVMDFLGLTVTDSMSACSLNVTLQTDYFQDFVPDPLGTSPVSWNTFVSMISGGSGMYTTTIAVNRPPATFDPDYIIFSCDDKNTSVAVNIHIEDSGNPSIYFDGTVNVNVQDTVGCYSSLSATFKPDYFQDFVVDTEVSWGDFIESPGVTGGTGTYTGTMCISGPPNLATDTFDCADFTASTVPVYIHVEDSSYSSLYVDGIINVNVLDNPASPCAPLTWNGYINPFNVNHYENSTIYPLDVITDVDGECFIGGFRPLTYEIQINNSGNWVSSYLVTADDALAGSVTLNIRATDMNPLSPVTVEGVPTSVPIFS